VIDEGLLAAFRVIGSPELSSQAVWDRGTLEVSRRGFSFVVR
jgi:hypothetical protein